MLIAAPPRRTLRFACAPSLLAASLACLLVACSTPVPQHVDIVHAPADGDVAPWVIQQQKLAKREGRTLLVYVGATWCEPCQRFHRAAAAGALDQRFPTLRLLEFDHDRDHERLRAAGYVSRMIPLFALPGADGRSTGRQIEGSVKGDGAIEEIAPRLRTLSEGG